jgi:hypothetical protein
MTWLCSVLHLDARCLDENFSRKYDLRYSIYGASSDVLDIKWWSTFGGHDVAAVAYLNPGSALDLSSIPTSAFSDNFPPKRHTITL